jgi:hypothetical protein
MFCLLKEQVLPRIPNTMETSNTTQIIQVHPTPEINNQESASVEPVRDDFIPQSHRLSPPPAPEPPTPHLQNGTTLEKNIDNNSNNIMTTTKKLQNISDKTNEKAETVSSLVSKSTEKPIEKRPLVQRAETLTSSASKRKRRVSSSTSSSDLDRYRPKTKTPKILEDSDLFDSEGEKDSSLTSVSNNSTKSAAELKQTRTSTETKTPAKSSGDDKLKQQVIKEFGLNPSTKIVIQSLDTLRGYTIRKPPLLPPSEKAQPEKENKPTEKSQAVKEPFNLPNSVLNVNKNPAL